MTEAEKTTTTYVGREDVSIEAERFSAKQPQIRNTVSNARKHHLVRKNGSRSEIQVGDFIIRGADGQVDSMPAPLFHQLFEIDADEVERIADEKAQAEAEARESTREERQAAVDAKAEAAADAADAAEETTTDEPPVNAADAVDYGGAPVHGDDDMTEAEAIQESDEVDAANAAEAEKEAAVSHAESIFSDDDKPADPPAAPKKKAAKKRGKKK